MNLTEKTPHLPTRREGDNRLVREVDDMITVFTFLDERKLLDNLPKYVADGPDNMPTTRLYEGDLKVFMEQLVRMDEKMAALSSTLAIVVHDVRVLQSKSTSTTTWCASAVNQSTPVRRVNNKTVNVTQRAAGPTTETTGGISSCSSLINNNENRSSCTADNVNNGVNVVPPRATGTDWASASALQTYSPYVSSNRFDALGTDDTDLDDRDNDQRFTTVRSKHNKRRRQHSSPTQARAEAVQTTSQRTVKQRRGPLMLGKSSSTSVISAANKLRKKTVLCVDNVSTSCTATDMTSFITAMHIDVITCFEVKPRRRRNDSAASVNRRAFRICIYSDDVDRFLNADMWPDSITISEWFFKPSSVDRDNNRPQRVNDYEASAVAVAVRDSSTTVRPTDGLAVSESSDETILAAYEVNMDIVAANNDGE